MPLSWGHPVQEISCGLRPILERTFFGCWGIKESEDLHPLSASFIPWWQEMGFRWARCPLLTAGIWEILKSSIISLIMQKSFNLACFIWNYARPSNPAKFLLRGREAGALGLLSAERRIPAMRPRLPALGRISRCGCCWSGSANVPFHRGQQVHPPSLTHVVPG